MSLTDQDRGIGELGVELPDPKGKQSVVQPKLLRWVTADAQGDYEVFVGPAQHTLGTEQAQQTALIVTDEKELRFDLEILRPQPPVAAGLVLDRQAGQPVAGAKLIGVYRYESAGPAVAAVADEQGAFQIERAPLHRMVLLVTSPDGELAELFNIGAVATR